MIEDANDQCKSEERFEPRLTKQKKNEVAEALRASH